MGHVVPQSPNQALVTTAKSVGRPRRNNSQTEIGFKQNANIFFWCLQCWLDILSSWKSGVSSLGPSDGKWLKNMTQVWLSIDKIRPLSWNEDAYDHLVLPEDQKSLLLSFVRNHKQSSKEIDDVIAGKGESNKTMTWSMTENIPLRRPRTHRTSEWSSRNRQDPDSRSR